jgi:hypothetical protein
MIYKSKYPDSLGFLQFVLLLQGLNLWWMVCLYLYLQTSHSPVVPNESFLSGLGNGVENKQANQLAHCRF